MKKRTMEVETDWRGLLITQIHNAVLNLLTLKEKVENEELSLGERLTKCEALLGKIKERIRIIEQQLELLR